MQLTDFKSWASCLLCQPRRGMGHILTYITCPGDAWTPGSEGRISRYDVTKNQPIAVECDSNVSTDVFQYSPCGAFLLTFTKLLPSFVLLEADDLKPLYTVEYSKYCPYVDLPLALSGETRQLLDRPIIQNLTASKLILREEAVQGLSLRAEAMVIVVPLFSADSTKLSISHIYLQETLGKSEVEVHDLTSCIAPFVTRAEARNFEDLPEKREGSRSSEDEMSNGWKVVSPEHLGS